MTEENSEKNQKTDNAENPELAACRKERDEYLDGWKRAKAELLNFKKEEEERIRFLTSIIQAELVSEIIPVLEGFNKGLELWPGDGDEKKGMRLVFQKFEEVLKKLGLESFSPEIGSPFDPATSECVAVSDSGPPDTITEIMEKGYSLKNRVIKPARVKVAK